MTKIREGYKETEIGVIPEDWEVTTFKNIIENTQLGINEKSSEKNTGIPLIKMGNLTIGGFDFSKIERLETEIIDNYSDYILEYGDFLFNTRNTPELVGKSATWKFQDRLSVFNSNIMRISVSYSINTFWLSYYFASRNGWKSLKQISTGTTSVGAIYTKDLVKVKIPVPPLSEQKCIAEILSTTDAHIEKLDKIIEDYQLLKKGMMKKLLTEGIGHTEFKETEIGRIPKDWEVKRISNICIIGRGRVISKKEIQQNLGSFPVYSSQTTNDGCMGYINSYDFEGEFVTWTTDGVNAGSTFYRNGKFNCTNVCGTLKLKNENLISYKFLSLILNNFTDKYVVRNGNPKLMNNIMGLIEIPIPTNIEEQNRISELIFSLNNYMGNIKSEREDYIFLKKYLMEELLLGRKRVSY